jgi:lysophospholipase L1-like esterase
VPGPATPTIGASPDAPRVVVAPPRTDRTWSRRLLQALAVVLVLMVLDLVLGAVLATTGRLPGTQGDVRRQIEAAITATMDAPAVRSEPWAQGFGEDMAAFELQEPHYLPYLVRGFQPFESTYVNTTAEERMSYRPTQPAGVDPLRVAFFGGSTMFGVGQRDEHTIPSEFARLAEDAGVAVEVHNYGFPGWVSWQEFQYLERLLAEDERYDLVVFFDGFNEFQVQQDQFSPDPTHNGAAATDQLAQDFHDEHERPPGYFDWVHDLTSAYTENSAVSRLVERLRGDDEVLSTPSGATPDQQADAALDIYGRSRQMITDLTGQDPPVQFFWQPRKGGWPASVTDRLPPSVADISHVLDGREDDVYIDEVHTNEEGARLIAAAMWDELGAGLERLGDDR